MNKNTQEKNIDLYLTKWVTQLNKEELIIFNKVILENTIYHISIQPLNKLYNYLANLTISQNNIQKVDVILNEIRTKNTLIHIRKRLKEIMANEIELLENLNKEQLENSIYSKKNIINKNNRLIANLANEFQKLI
jgi:hypothetical protein